MVDQAYFKVDKVGGAVDTTLGRQFYGTPGDLVIYFGPSDKPWYGLPTNALDAARFDWSNENVGVTAVAGKIVGKLIGTAVPAADIDVTGLVASLKGNENMSGSVYLYNQMTHATGALGSNGFITRTSPFPAVVPVATVAGGRNDMLYVLGVKGKAKMGAAWISGELDKNYGNNRPSASAATAAGSVTDSDAFYRGWAALLDAGYKADVSGVAAFMPWFELGIGSGQHDTNSNKNRQFTAITGDYRPGSIRGRFAAFNNGVAIAAYPGLGVGTTLGVNTANTTLANSVIWGLGVKANPASLTKLTAGLSFWDFRTQTIVAPIMDQNETTARANAAGSQHDVSAGNKHLGSEIDLDLTWKHSENVSFSTGWGSFLPGGIIKEAVQSAAGSGGSPATGTGVSPATLAYFDVRVKF